MIIVQQNERWLSTYETVDDWQTDRRL